MNESMRQTNVEVFVTYEKKRKQDQNLVTIFGGGATKKGGRCPKCQNDLAKMFVNLTTLPVLLSSPPSL